MKQRDHIWEPVVQQNKISMNIVHHSKRCFVGETGILIVRAITSFPSNQDEIRKMECHILSERNQYITGK